MGWVAVNPEIGLNDFFNVWRAFGAFAELHLRIAPVSYHQRADGRCGCQRRASELARPTSVGRSLCEQLGAKRLVRQKEMLDIDL